MGRKYEKLDIETFGRHLLTTGDLDPIYIALNRVPWPEEQRRRWLVAYCAFYHSGAASWFSEHDGAAFWDAMHVAAVNEQPSPAGGRWPRGHERRHFRGGQAVRAVADWRRRYSDCPDQLFTYVAGSGGSFHEVSARAREHLSVGSWLSFKMADLVDACLGIEIDQSDASPFLYETPRASLLREWRTRLGLPPTAKPKDEKAALEGMLSHLRTVFADLTVPHKPGTAIDMFCLETVACKHQSHLNGHYPLWNDVDEITAGLEVWGSTCSAAADFAEGLPSR